MIICKYNLRKERLLMATSINIRLDEDLKRDIESFFFEIGLDTSTATRMFFKQCLIEKALPFLPRTKNIPTVSSMHALDALSAIQAESVKRGLDAMSMDDIDADIAESRLERRAI
jgi:DNA-damage-inducible protein J